MAILSLLKGLNEYITDPAFKDYLTQLDAPKSVFYFLAAIGLISFIALKEKK